MNDKNWIKYYDITKVKTTPRKNLSIAIENFSKEKILFPTLAIDLGCGAGADSIELLKQNWSVLAIDVQSAAIANLLLSARQLSLSDDKLKTRLCSFETLSSLPPAYLINASFSLPFVKPNYFYILWKIILRALHSGGRFSGAFFGIHDSWNTRSNMIFFKRHEICHLFRFSKFKIEFFEEEEDDGPDALGYIKHWHKYFVVAKKN